MDLEFTLQKFSGPMDLLLHLIEKDKINIFDIPIVQITDQYFEYLHQMQEQDMDGMSDFMVMAATLLDIKCRMLLPPEKDEEGEEIDPRAELVEKLLEYKIYKYMSFELKEKEADAADVMYHRPSIPPEVKKYREPVDLDQLLGNVTLARLNAVFRDVMKRQTDRIDPIRSTFGRIEKDEVDQKKVLHNVTERIRRGGKCSFKSLLTEKTGKMYVVVTFLTVLELMKIGRVNAEQDDTFGDILLTPVNVESWEEEELSSLIFE